MRIFDEVYRIELVVKFAPLEHNGEHCVVDGIHFITIADDIDTMEQIKTIAHECIHFVMSVFDKRGLIYHHQNDEHFTYYFDWVFSTILKNGGFN